VTAGTSASARIAAALARYSGRPTLVAIAAMNLITGGVAAWILAPLSFGADVDFLRRGAQGLLDGTSVPDFVFTPLCALISVPLALMPPALAAAAMTTLGLGVLAVGTIVETRPMPTVDRFLVGIAVVTALPVVNELLLGQVTILIAAGVYPTRDRDSVARGVALGIVLALVPKPLVIPMLLWLAVWRRRALTGAILTASGLTVIAIVMLGPGAYGAWFGALVGAGEITRQANFSIWTDGVTPAAIVLALLGVAAFAASLTDPRRGFVAALLVGLLLAPYTLLYAASILLLAIAPALAVAPLRTRALALVMNSVLMLAPAAWLGTGLVAVAWEPTGRALRSAIPGDRPTATPDSVPGD